MKKLLKGFVLWLLRKLAWHRLQKFQGKVIAITGSIGKTSTKEAIFSVLNTKFRVQRSAGSMNSEFGLPLTILEIESGFSSARLWAWLLLKAFWHSLSKMHSDILLVELGVDKPGDMDELTALVRPDIAVITNIAPVHMDEGQFNTLESIFEEKSKLAYRISENGKVLLNIDNPFLKHLAKNLPKKRILTYGRDADKVDFSASGISQTIDGLAFRFNVFGRENSHFEVKTGILGKHNVYTLVPAIVIGLTLGMAPEEILQGINKFQLPPGRLNFVPAVKEAMFLDGSYNSSPEAVKAALETLAEIAGEKRKVAILGNMNELGENSKKMHEDIGEIIPATCDVLVSVGAQARIFAQKAQEKGMPEKNIFTFKNVAEAIAGFGNILKEDDLVLVKGSQNNVRLERLIKEFMRFPEEARDVLVRQEKEWALKI